MENPQGGVPIKIIVKQGHLFKYNGYGSVLKEKFVILGEKRIAYYNDSNPNRLILQGEFYFRRESRVIPYRCSLGSGFQIIFNDEKQTHYEFISNEKDVIDDWIEKISSVIRALFDVPDEMYFIPDLKPIHPSLSGFKLPEGFPKIVIKLKGGGTVPDPSINNDVLRPEDSVKPSFAIKTQNIVPHVLVYERQIANYGWGPGIKSYMKFDNSFSQFVARARAYVKAFVGPTDFIPKDKILVADDLSEEMQQIHIYFNDARFELMSNQKDSVSAAMHLDPLWEIVNDDSDIETKWRDYCMAFIRYASMNAMFTNDGVDLTKKVVSHFDDAIENIAKFRDKMIDEMRQGKNIAIMTVKIMDVMFPGFEWTGTLMNMNAEIPLIHCYTYYQMMKSLPMYYWMYQNDDSCYQGEDIRDILNYVKEKHQAFLVKLKAELIKFIELVTAPSVMKMMVPSLITSIKISLEISEQESASLYEKMMQKAI